VARCVECWYAKRSTVTTFEPAWTCLHPMSLEQSRVGYPLVCQEMRAEKGACGPEGALFMPNCMDGPEPAIKFRQ
jgi:hypothetical protein